MGIGAGIAINYAEVTNAAFIGTGAEVIADGVVIEAKMTQVDKPFELAAIKDGRDSIVLGADHGLHTGDAVIYDNGGGTSIGGLTSGETYYVVLHDTRTFNIFPYSAADLSADLTEVLGSFKAFDAAGKVSTDDNTIDLGSGHGFQTGLAVKYSGESGTVIGGLEDGKTYYVIADDDAQIRLTSTLVAAIAGTAIDLVEAGSGTHKLTPFWDFEFGGNVSYTNNWIDLGADHMLKDGDLVVYSKGHLLNTKPLGGLTDGATYAVKVDGGNPNRIQLLDTETEEVQSLTFSVGDVVQGLLFDHKLTMVKPTAVKLAATAADAFLRNTIEFDKAGATGSEHRIIDVSHHFRAEAESGAGAAKVGVAGSLALNIVANHTEALIKSGAAVTAGAGDVVLKAVNAQGNAATAAAQVSAGDVGVGASVALNVLPVNMTRAEIEDTAALTGGHHLVLSASSVHAVLTTAKAGAAGGTAVSPVVAVAYVEDVTTARLGTLNSSTLSLSGTATIEASHTGAAFTTVDASVAGEKVAVGAAVGVNIVDSSALATAARDLSASGDVTISALTAQSSNMEVIASAKGNKGEDEGAKDSDSEAQSQADSATGGGKTLPKVQDNLDTSNDNAKTNTGGGDGEGTESPSVGVAAGIGVNWVISRTTASIADGIRVTAGGALKLNAESQTDLTAKVLGAALSFDSDAGVGAAVALNVADVTNMAFLGSGAVVQAHGISIRAVAPAGKSNDFTTWALAIGGGKDYGAAGSAGVNVMIMNTEASVREGASLTSLGGIEVRASNPIAYQNLAGGGGVGKKAGVGVAVAANILVQNTHALLGDSVRADAREQLSISADASVGAASSTIRALAAGLSGSVGSAVAGSLTTNTSRSVIEAFASGASELHSTGRLTIAADKSAVIESLSGVIAIGIKGTAVSGAAAYNEIADTVRSGRVRTAPP